MIRWNDYAGIETYPKKDGYYWIAFELDNGKRDTYIAYWMHLRWWIADEDVSSNVLKWSNMDIKYPKFPNLRKGINRYHE